MSQKEGLGTQNKLPAYFSPFTLNNIPLKMTYWANRLNGDSTTGNIDPYTVANDLKTTARTLNIVLYGDENGVNQKFVGMMSSIPFTINNLPIKMLTWANRLNGDPTGGTIDPQSIAHEIQYCSFLLNQVLNGGAIDNSTPLPQPPSEEIEYVEVEVEEDVIIDYPETTLPSVTRFNKTTTMPETTLPPVTRFNKTTAMPETTLPPVTTIIEETTLPSVTHFNKTTAMPETQPPVTTMIAETTLPSVTRFNKTMTISNSDSTTPYTYSTTPIVTQYKTIPSAFTTMR